MSLPSYDKRPATPASGKAMQENDGETEVPRLHLSVLEEIEAAEAN